eukprot:TRINITY_DN1931_c0_g1_i5.p1 TRINITY_DN1931_c0_g1~~TRINITY_DN1931_c0_g1_i5.p1  ORF type:complete len:465 (+),score=115.54 TRINITY_DN1931_c0_g1_i5:421-1815(+)
MIKIRKLKEWEQLLSNGIPIDFNQLNNLSSHSNPTSSSSNQSITPTKRQISSNSTSPSTPSKIGKEEEGELGIGDLDRREKTIKLLNETLTKQYNEILAKYKEKKEKGEARDTSDLQLCKEIKADIDWLKLFNVSHPNQMPIYHYKTIDRITINDNKHLSDVQLECSITNLHTVDTSLLSGSIYLYISIPYPSSESPQTISTSSASIVASSSTFDFNTKFKIERKKSTNLAFERKKITIEIQQSKLLGFGKTVLFSGTVKLSDLLNKCTSNQSLEFKKGKKIAGILDVTLRLRTPLLGPDQEKHSEKILVLDHKGEDMILSSPPKPSIIQHQPVHSPSPKKSITTVKSPVHEEEEEFNSIENIICNDVLEYELLVTKERKRGAKGRELEDLEEREQQIQLKLQILAIQVETGQLSPEVYAEQLKQKVVFQKKELDRYVQKGQSIYASVVKKHIEIMENEIRSMG